MKKKKDGYEEDSRVVFYALDISGLDVPFPLLAKYKQYLNLLWKTNVCFGFDDLSEKDKDVLEKIEFDIVFFDKNEMALHILYIIEKDYYTTNMKEIVLERGDIEFAKRILNCMYSDIGMFPDFDTWSHE